MGFWFEGGLIQSLFTPERTAALIRALFILVFGILIARVASTALGRMLVKRGRAPEAVIARRMTFYGIAVLVLASALHHLGFNLGILFGAAGILTVAIGFASQTSASNLISGLFLLGERSFVPGDTIQIGEHTGEVLSIDLLSVKLRTLDNVLVRVSNEEIIKSRVRNLTRFPIRRSDTILVVSHSTSLEKVRSALAKAALEIPNCLVDPGPQCLVRRFAESGMELQLSAWSSQQGFGEFEMRFREALKKALDETGVQLPVQTMVARQAAPPA